MSPVELLRAIRAILADETRWLRPENGEEAVDANGVDCPAVRPEAVRWDVYGALRKAARDHGLVDVALSDAPLTLLARAIEDGFVATGPEHVRPGSAFLTVVRWHDAPERTHAEVLAVIDAAITLAEDPQANVTSGDRP